MKKILLMSIFIFFNITFSRSDRNFSYEDQIIEAVEKGDLEMVTKLVDLIDVNFEKDGKTLLERACFCGYKAIASELVKKGAIVKNYCMLTPFEIEGIKGQLDDIGLKILEKGTIAYKDGTSRRGLRCSELYFLRHGNTFATENKIFIDTDSQQAFLSEKGKREIEQVLDSITEITPDVILTSPLTRCRDSLDVLSEKLAKKLQGVEIQEVPVLRGIKHGDWEGKNKAHLVGADLLTWFAKWNAYIFAKSPGGESLAELLIRANELLDYIDKKYADKKVLIIGHGSFSWALTVLLRLYPDPSVNDYTIVYGELKKLC
jgi:broad specificity phosphatase PhoE